MMRTRGALEEQFLLLLLHLVIDSQIDAIHLFHFPVVMPAPANLGHTPPHSRQWLHEELFSVVATWTNGARESVRALITQTITTIAGGGNKENFVSTEETTKRSRVKAHPYGAVAIPRLRELGTNGRVDRPSPFVLRTSGSSFPRAPSLRQSVGCEQAAS